MTKLLFKINYLGLLSIKHESEIAMFNFPFEIHMKGLKLFSRLSEVNIYQISEKTRLTQGLLKYNLN